MEEHRLHAGVFLLALHPGLIRARVSPLARKIKSPVARWAGRRARDGYDFSLAPSYGTKACGQTVKPKRQHKEPRARDQL